MTLQTLLTRAQQATGADRELDRDIHLTFFPEDFASKIMRGEYAVESWELAHGGMSYVSLNSGGTSGGTHPIARGTASVDAALGLVERVLPGWRKSVVDLRPEPCEAYVWPRGHPSNIQGESAEPALALICALLAAKIAEAQTIQEDAA